ncbi:MAG: hypothetical protein QNK32_08815 [Porticoccus sp.]|nr:hypothetical protein [Porticoccus sp.]
MSTLLEHKNWPLIARLRPQLHQHVSIFPQVYRGERWYVLRDESSGRHLRFSESAYTFIGRLDGDATVQEIFDNVIPINDTNTLNPAVLSQDEVIVILTQLFAIGVLKGGLPISANEFFRRYQNERSQRKYRAIMNPLAIRIPLIDPDKFLNRLIPWVRPLFSRTGMAIWFVVVITGVLLGLASVSELGAALSRDILAPGNLILMLVVFVFIKTVHEFAHAFAVKMWGGEVHDMGITLLVLAPIPYMDASAAWGFRDKHKRILVGAIGVLIELFIAAIALFVWLLVEPGLMQDAALNALLIASVSTLLFNANPLLRFDGYYVLQDWVEIPNLYTRSSRYYLYLIKRYLLGLENIASPVTAVGEPAWFVLYGLASFVYRMIILVVIVFFLAEKYLFLGVALAVWAVSMQIIMPLIRGMNFLWASPILLGCRVRAVTVTLLLVGIFSAVILWVPTPLTTRAEGIVWVEDQARVFVETEGFVEVVLVASGAKVEVGTPLIQMRSLPLETRILKLAARYRELEIRTASERFERRVQSAMTKEELSMVATELIMLKEQKKNLVLYSKVAGVFVLPDTYKVKGRYLLQGDLLGYVFSPEHLIVRTVVPQSDIGLVRQKVEQVQIRFAERLGEVIEVPIIRQTPGGSLLLPSRALGVAGGGKIAVTTTDKEGLTAAEKVFQVDLSVPKQLDITGVSERVYVRFDHGSEPLFSQWLRSGRQLVLSRLAY